MNAENDVDFLRSKIYEKLSYLPEPAHYSSSIPWIVQNQIAATNGIHYADRIGKLKTYPVYHLPIPSANGSNLLLDIGSGWGRWLVSAALKHYIPIGIDIRLEFCETQQKMLKALKIKGYSLVADLACLPFKDNVFDVIWSFSVLQHVHIVRLKQCLADMNRILHEEGFVFLQFPNKNGIRNRIVYQKYIRRSTDDYNNWDVRYYAIDEYKSLFEEYLANFSYTNHSFLGIGILPEDLKYVSLKNKIFCLASLGLSLLTQIFPQLTKYADSIYVQASKKNKGLDDLTRNIFLERHQHAGFDNLNIVTLLRCPISGGELVLDKTRTKLISKEAGVCYPIIQDIPILVKSETRSL